MRAVVVRVLRHAFGWGFLALGVVGLVLPVLQGWLLIALGALLLSADVPLFGRLVVWVENRFPVVGSAIRRLRRRLFPGDDEPPQAPPPVP